LAQGKKGLSHQPTDKAIDKPGMVVTETHRNMRLMAALTFCVISAGCLSGPARPPCEPDGQVGSICGFRNPEDLEFVRSARLIVVSNMRMDAHGSKGGFLSGFLPASKAIVRLWPDTGGTPAEPEPALGNASCNEPPDAESFYPHGIASSRQGDRLLLYVVAHRGKLGGREAIEVFEIRGMGTGTSLVWKACIPTDGGVQANDLAVAPDGTVVAANYQPDGSLLNTLSSALLGTKTGDIMRWRSGEGWHHLAGTDAAMANGVALSTDGKMLFYTETMSGTLYRRPLESGAGTVTVEIGGNPDNITWTGRGTLLVATHTAGAAFLLCSLGREPCKTSWEVVEVDPDTMAAKPIFSHNGEQVGAVATALEVGRTLYLGSVFDDRVGIVEFGQRLLSPN